MYLLYHIFRKKDTKKVKKTPNFISFLGFLSDYF